MPASNLRGAYAGFVTRAAAFILDIIIISVVIGASNWLFITLLAFVGINPSDCPLINRDRKFLFEICVISSWLLKAYSIAFPFVYLIFFWTLSGQTPGKYFLRLRIVTADRKRIKLPRAISRIFGYWVSFITLGYGFLKVLVDDRRRGLHDNISGTYVIYDWDARQDVHFLDKVNWQISHLRQRAALVRRGRAPVLPEDRGKVIPAEVEPLPQPDEQPADSVDEAPETQVLG